MGLGRRDARRHDTAAIQSFTAASGDSGGYSVGQQVMTLDGFPGTIEAISSGFSPGSDVYHVALDGGLGGGEYTETQISTVSSTSAQVAEASSIHTAADDYPELGTILVDRPDIAPNTRLGSKVAASEADIRSWYDSTRTIKTPLDPSELHEGQADAAELQASPAGEHADGHMATWKGHYLGYYPSEAVARHHLYHTMHEAGDDSGEVVHRDVNEKVDRREDVRQDRHLWEHDNSAWLAKHDPKSHAVLNADDLTSRVDDAVHASPEQAKFLDSNPTGPTKYSAKEDQDEKDELGAHCSRCRYWGVNYRGGMSCPLCGSQMVAGSPSDVANQVHDPSDFTDSDVDSDADSEGSESSDSSGDSSSTTAAKVAYAWDDMDDLSKAKVQQQLRAHEQHSWEDPDPDCGFCVNPHTAGMGHLPPKFEVGDRVIDFRGEAGTVHSVRDSGHPGKSNKIQVLHDGDDPKGAPYSREYYENVYDHHPDAPREQIERSERRIGDAKNANEAINSAMPEDSDWLLDQQEQGPSKYSSLDVDALLVTAVSDVDFRFQLTAAWSDVQRKAKRIRAEGGVHVTLATEGMVVGNVKGDTNVYESGLQRMPGKQSIQAWSCGCKWGAYHWGAADDNSRFAGRMCSHVLALKFEAQSRGMFGKSVYEDNDKPKWVPRKVVVKYDIDADKSLKARSSLLDMSAEAPAITLVREGVLDGDLILAMGIDMTAAVNSPWGEPIADVQPKAPGATRPHNPNDNPGSMGFASAPDPQGWGMMNPSMNNAEGMGGVSASLNDEFLFEASDNEDGAEAILHDEPEAALPSTDGVTIDLPRHDENVMPAESSGMPNGKSPWQDPGNDEELTPEDLSIATMGSVDDIVAEFQKSAGHLAVDGAVNADSSDIAAAAREFLAKEAVKTFSPAEQAAIINEGADQKAANLDRLDIAGTHYEQVEASLSDAEDDDQLWS